MGKKSYEQKSNEFIVKDRVAVMQVCIPNIIINSRDIHNKIHKVRMTSRQEEGYSINSSISVFIPFFYRNAEYRLNILIFSKDLFYKNSLNHPLEELSNANLLSGFIYEVNKRNGISDKYSYCFLSSKNEVTSYMENGRECFRISPLSISSSFCDKRACEWENVQEFLQYINDAMKEFPLDKIKRIFMNVEGL